MIQFTSIRAQSNSPGFWARVHEGDTIEPFGDPAMVEHEQQQQQQPPQQKPPAY